MGSADCGGKVCEAFNLFSSSSSSTVYSRQSDPVSYPYCVLGAPIHQFFLEVRVIRLTATDPMCAGLMGVNGMDEFCTVPVDNFPSVGL
jgi:hypothetical protein